MKVVLDTMRQARDKSDTWVIPVFEGRLNAAAKAFGFSARQARAWGFDGQASQSVIVQLDGDHRQGLLIGAGKKQDLTPELARGIVGRSVRRPELQKAKAATVLFVGAALAEGKVAADTLVESLAEGAALGAYTFSLLKLKSAADEAQPRLPKKLVIGMDRLQRGARRRFADGLIMARWANWACDLLNQSQSHVTASTLAAAARRAARGAARVQCRVLGKAEITAARMGLLLAVNQGSRQAPRFIIIKYTGGSKNEAPICLIGKGLTYDTGGYNIKPGESMRGMHMDKGGGVGALAAFFAAAEMKVRKNIVCLVPATDNQISGTAMVPGDVYVGLAGISVEVDNTDAEGRLVLADALAYAKKFKPSRIVDMATLTGAAVVALGDQASALFCNDDALANELLEHADQAGELVWRMPLWGAYDDKLKSKTADVKNVGDRWAGAITAALFLQRFVPDDTPWCHLDIAGKMTAVGNHPYYQSGLSCGFGPTLLARWLRH